MASFDTVVLFGNNFGIFGTPEGARTTLRAWAKATKPSARVFVESTNAFFGGAPGFDRSYYRRNKERGDAPGQARFRYHVGHLVGSWFPWLFVSRAEMREILKGTGWHQARVLGEGLGDPYVAILEKR
jgi:hypothetical protein